jgi:ubiquinone biosynthesis protein
MQNYFPTIVRLVQIIRVLTPYFIVPLLLPKRNLESAPIRLRKGLEFLGGAWVKMGQALALRFDLLPAEYCTELLRLLDEAKPFPYAIVREIVRIELGAYPEQIFFSFDVKPVAAASIAQVHKAVGFDGRQLAVKIQRPLVRQQFASDYRIMHALSYVVDLFSPSKARTTRAFIDEFQQWTSEELDFRKEARNGHRMWLFSKNDPTHVDAKIIWEYSTERILTTQFMNGIRLLDLIKAIHNGDQAFLNDFARRGYDRLKIARRISWNFFNQLFRDEFFHADLHPGNIFVLPGNVIGYVDFGIAAQLSTNFKSSIQDYVRYLIEGKIEEAVAELVRWLNPSRPTKLDQFQHDLMVLLEQYRFGTGGEVGQDSSLKLTSDLLIKNMSLMRRHRLVATRELSLYFKAVLTADAVVYEIEPGYKLFTDVRKFFASAQYDDLRYIMSRNNLQFLGSSVYRATQLVTTVRRAQRTGRFFEVWLETLQTRLAVRGFLAIAFGLVGFLLYNEGLEAFGAAGATAYWISGGLLVCVVTLLALMWRSGRELSAIHSRSTLPQVPNEPD